MVAFPSKSQENYETFCLNFQFFIIVSKVPGTVNFTKIHLILNTKYGSGALRGKVLMVIGLLVRKKHFTVKCT